MARSCGWPAPAACISAPSWAARRAGGSAIRRWRTPVYLARKGTYPWSHALPSLLRHTLKNAARSPWPEPWADRFGRFRGNLLALADWARGRLSPGRILEL